MEKVKNIETVVPKNKEMNDQDYLNDILESEKNMSNNYSTAINEMSNNVLYKEIINMFMSSKDLGREAFDLAFKCGWYELTKANEDDITAAYDKMFEKLKEF